MEHYPTPIWLRTEEAGIPHNLRNLRLKVSRCFWVNITNGKILPVPSHSIIHVSDNVEFSRVFYTTGYGRPS